MSSGMLKNTYKQYKDDTLAFTTWLSQNAKKCGWKSATKLQASTFGNQPAVTSAIKGPRLKGKDRKLAREAEKSTQPPKTESNFQTTIKYEITTKELLEQAEIVAKATETKFPDGIQKVLGRAIGVRKRFAAWFRETDPLNKYASNEGHQYFIDTLEKAAGLLGQAKGRSTNAEKGGTQADVDVLRNYFSALDVEHSQEEDEDLPTLSDVVPISAKPHTKASTVEVYDLAASGEDLAFQVFCFFEDLHLLQGEVRKAWNLFKTNKLSLVAATIITTAAVGLVSRAEKELIAANPNAIKESRSYQDLALIIFNSESLKQGIDADRHMKSTDDLEITPFKNFMYLPVGRTLMRIAQHQRVIEISDYPAPIQPMRFNYIAKPELLDAPHMKKIQEEDELICQLVLDHTCQEKTKKAMNDIGKGQEHEMLLSTTVDVFTESIQPVWEKGIVSMRSVFASRLLLDIHGICPDFDGQNLLYDEGRIHDQLFGFIRDDKGVLDTEDGIRWHSKDHELLLGIHAQLENNLLEPKFPYLKMMYLQRRASEGEEPPITVDQMKDFPPAKIIHMDLGGTLKPGMHDEKPEPDQATMEQYKKNAKKLNLTPIKPNKNPALIMNKNPLLCGTLILSQMVSTQVAGVALANHHMSIFAVAHLYNAIRKMKLTNIVWPEMEKIISLHAGPIFANDVPTTPAEMKARFFFRLGGNRSLTRFRRDQMSKMYLNISPASSLLLEFFRSKQPLEKTIYQLQESIDSKGLGRGTETRKTANSVSLLSQHKFIDQLEGFAKTAIAETEIPYLGLTKVCIQMLNDTSEHLENIGYEMAPRLYPEDSKNDGLVFMVGEILHENSIMKNREPGRLLRTAATSFEAWYEDMNSDDSKEEWCTYFPNRDPSRKNA